jgi:hypothetical protein
MAGLSFEVTARLADVLLARSVTVPFRDPTKLIQVSSTVVHLCWTGGEAIRSRGISHHGHGEQCPMPQTLKSRK